MKTSLTILILLLFVKLILAVDIEIKGQVIDEQSGDPLIGAHVVIPNTEYATTTDTEGNFRFFLPENEKYKVLVSHLGYQPIRQALSLAKSPEGINILIKLSPTIYSSDEVIITASRSTDNLNKVPARIDIISRQKIKNLPHQNIEDLLRQVPGINSHSPAGIFSMRPAITLRGLGGNEQGRTLVLADGTPLNKGDTGGVNWSGLNPDDIERIEVLHGPGSSVYGNNAMGGVINIITRKPLEKLEGTARVSYGTYNTLMSGLNLGGRLDNGMYFRVSGMYNNSDGYNDLPTDYREDPDYSVPRFLDEYSLMARAGWDIDPMFDADIQFSHQLNKKGEGEKIEATDGEYRHFNADILKITFNGNTSGFSYSLNTFYQHEDYFKLDERMRKGSYSRFDVRSDRIDKGVMLNLTNDFGSKNKLIYGAESRFGSVNGGDYYVTSPDSIINRGKLNNFALFLQDEQRLLDEKITLTVGLRWDYARFHDGYYSTTDGAWADVIPPLESHSWSALSPRIAAGFETGKGVKVYASYSRGFRASILDDLCRSGWMWVGPKIANPQLEPEYLDNWELGGSIKLPRDVQLSASLFYASGKDFLYYVATGDSLYGKRPIYQRQNITEVDIFGLEMECQVPLHENLNLDLSYVFNHSEICKFEENKTLEGKILTYTPEHQVKSGLSWKNSFCDVNFTGIFKGRQYTSDNNSTYLDPYTSFDIRFSKLLKDRFTVGAEVFDIFDNQHQDSEFYLSPGRMLKLGFSVVF